MNIPAEKEKFLNEEFLLLSFGGAFQHAKVYNKSASTSERKAFRAALVQLLASCVVRQYALRPVTTIEHCKNIERMCETISRKWHHVLVGGEFRVGICQKLLNLYLKYLWCTGRIKEPPHCPIDSIILSQCEGFQDVKWTAIKKIGPYMQIIEAVSVMANNEGLSIAAWELKNFRRRAAGQ